MGQRRISTEKIGSVGLMPNVDRFRRPHEHAYAPHAVAYVRAPRAAMSQSGRYAVSNTCLAMWPQPGLRLRCSSGDGVRHPGRGPPGGRSPRGRIGLGKYGPARM
jgi:hypothetical protein